MRCVPCSSMGGYSRVAAEALSIQLGFSCRIDTASTVMDCTTGEGGCCFGVLSVQRETWRGHGDDDNGLREVVVRSPAVRWTTCGESHRWECGRKR